MWIISNNCFGSILNQIIRHHNNTVFTWSFCYADEMVKLYKEYDNINFNNYKLIQLSKEIDLKYNKNCLGEIHSTINENIYGLNIDNKFNLYFPHYLYGKYDLPTNRNNHIYFKENYNYLIDKYKERLKIQNKLTEKPFFIILAYPWQGWTEKHIHNMLKIKSNYNLLIITDMMITDKRIINVENLQTPENNSPPKIFERLKSRLIPLIMDKN